MFGFVVGCLESCFARGKVEAVIVMCLEFTNVDVWLSI